MNTAKKRDWGLIVAGVLLVICAAFCIFAPGVALVTLTMIAGAAFLVSGVFDIVSWVQFRKVMSLSGWALAYAVLDVIVGLMLLIHPLAFSVVLPWLIGAFVIVFGAFEIAAALGLKKAGAPFWGWALFSAIVGILCGVCFFLYPGSLVVYLAFFVMLRGVSLVVYGFSAGKAIML